MSQLMNDAHQLPLQPQTKLLVSQCLQQPLLFSMEKVVTQKDKRSFDFLLHFMFVKD